jgi:hypothetical protein
VIDPTATLNGSSGATTPTTIYDGGPRTVTSKSAVLGFTNSGGEMIAAAAGLRTKVLYFRASCTIFTTAGNLSITDGAGGANLLLTGMVSALAQVTNVEASGLVLTSTSVNTALQLFSPGTFTVHYVLLYYQAP